MWNISYINTGTDTQLFTQAIQPNTQFALSITMEEPPYNPEYVLQTTTRADTHITNQMPHGHDHDHLPIQTRELPRKDHRRHAG